MDLIRKSDGSDATLVGSSGMMAYILDHNKNILQVTLSDLKRNYQATNSK